MSLDRLRALIADDSWAITFQSMGQYRTALLKEVDALRAALAEAQADAEPSRRELSDEQLRRFTEWLAAEMPYGTVISGPEYWAPRIARAVLRAAEPQQMQATKQTACTYPVCNCPFDAPSDPNWCARGLQRAAGGEG